MTFILITGKRVSRSPNELVHSTSVERAKALKPILRFGSAAPGSGLMRSSGEFRRNYIGFAVRLGYSGCITCSDWRGEDQADRR